MHLPRFILTLELFKAALISPAHRQEGCTNKDLPTLCGSCCWACPMQWSHHLHKDLLKSAFLPKGRALQPNTEPPPHPPFSLYSPLILSSLGCFRQQCSHQREAVTNGGDIPPPSPLCRALPSQSQPGCGQTGFLTRHRGQKGLERRWPKPLSFQQAQRGNSQLIPGDDS